MGSTIEQAQVELEFVATDCAALRELVPVLAARVAAIARRCAAGLDDDALARWLEAGLRGPHDAAFAQAWHAWVRLQLERGVALERLVGVIEDVRHACSDAIAEHHGSDVGSLRRAIAALDRWLRAAVAIALRVHVADDAERSRRNERLVTVGLVAAGIAHELRNPLSVMESSAFLLRKVVDGERGLRHVETITNQVKDCNRIVAALLELTRAGPVERSLLRPEDVLASGVSHAVVPDDIAVTTSVDEGLVLHASGSLLTQAIANLVMNAVRAFAGRPGTIQLSAQRRADEVELVVADDGPGFDPAVLPHAFEPLVTGQLAGIGLGLALVRSIAERHGGRVQAENRDGGGALVRLLLPAHGRDGGRS